MTIKAFYAIENEECVGEFLCVCLCVDRLKDQKLSEDVEFTPILITTVEYQELNILERALIYNEL